MAWRTFKALVFLGVLAAAACSSSSRKKSGGEPEAGAGGSAGGSEPSGGRAGSARTGGSAGLDGAGGEGGEGSTLGGTGGIARGGFGGSGGGAGFSAASGVTSAGNAGTAGSGGTTGVPVAWLCPASAYGDGACDCGCGVEDVDCADGEFESCEVCDLPGSCNGATCPGRIDPDDPTRCTPPPTDWGCATRIFGDGTCHCGCGVADSDCNEARIETCDVCNVSGSCSFGPCPGAIDPTNTGRCYVPSAWSCPTSFYGNGECDCGCGVPDPDCASSAASACARCLHGCSRSGCPGTIAPNDNRVCTAAPPSWTCGASSYGDGSLCDCGCGAMDPDCASSDFALCERCNGDGSCSAHACPGIIDAENPTRCDPPPPPAGWTCYEQFWADATCQCGCGEVDIDCEDARPESCEDCWGCSSALCPGSLLPGDTTKCLPPPPGWVCDESYWADGYACECGCGALDLDCQNASRASCDGCPMEGCSLYSTCADIKENDNAHCIDEIPGWTCGRIFYGDEDCDCGCGVLDIDCPSSSRSACEYCNTPGSCSENFCPGTISVDDNTTCE